MNHSQPLNPSAVGALEAYGWNKAVSDQYESIANSDNRLVRVARVDRATCLVATAAGVTGCRRGTLSAEPVTGDWAAARLMSNGGLTLDRLLPRTTSVARTNAMSSGEQLLAANVDTMLVLHGVDRPHRVGRLARLAVLGWDAGVNPVIVLTKIDLGGTPAASIEVDEAVAEIKKVIFDIDVVPVSNMTGAGIDRLGPYLRPGTTIGLVGESGAGKSSLVNRLAAQSVQRTGATRDSDHKGRHTTTSRDLVPIPGGAVLIDTPGLRSISMPVAVEGFARAYADLESLIADCRFNDCEHSAEPGCRIKRALLEGDLTPERWSGYLKLRREIAFEERRVVERERRAERRAGRRRLRQSPPPDEW
jgi:ribosome biogenesis GTPase